MSNYRDLKVWQKGIGFVEEIYRVSRDFPVNEQYGLVSQLQRAAVSIPSNIAEGRGRSGDVEFKRFINTALGSAAEVDTQLEIAHRLGYIDEVAMKNLQVNLIEIQKMLYGLKKGLN